MNKCAWRQTIHCFDLKFTIVATVKNKYRIEFTIYNLIGRTQNGHPVWPRAGSDISSCDVVDNINESEPYLHGEIKWDGCSNWYFDAQDRAMLHACTRRGLIRFGRVMAFCWDLASEMCLVWSPH